MAQEPPASVNVFISYAREDLKMAKRLYADLKQAGVSPWLDAEDLLPGQKWRVIINAVIKESSYVIALLSSRSLSKRGYVQKELKKALDVVDELPPSDIFVIPVRIDDCQPLDERLQDLHWVDLFPSYDEGLRQILRVLVQEDIDREETVGKPADAERDDQTGGPRRDITAGKDYFEYIEGSPQKARVWRNVALGVGGLMLLIVGAVWLYQVFSPPKELEEWTDPVTGMAFVRIPAGCFQMGSPETEKGGQFNEGPVHEVCVDGLWMGKYEVTQEQWENVMGENPAAHNAESIGADTKSYPVEQVSWDDVQEFIRQLNEKAGEERYRLPSEAEWEYAARAGTQTAYSFGNDADRLDEYAWYSENSRGKTHPVGQLKPNVWGLYDIYGNVGEWCLDWYDGNYYATSPKENPRGPESGSARVIRGGYWGHFARNCRAAFRGGNAPGFRDEALGFRLLRTPL